MSGTTQKCTKSCGWPLLLLELCVRPIDQGPFKEVLKTLSLLRVCLFLLSVPEDLYPRRFGSRRILVKDSDCNPLVQVSCGVMGRL